MLAIIDQKHNINNINLKLSFLQYSGAPAVFSKGKSLRVLQKACIKIAARAIYIYIFFFLYIHSTLLPENKNLLRLLFSSAN